MTLTLDESKFLSDHPHQNGNGVSRSKHGPHDGETKHERFLRLAPKRVQSALDALTQVGKLSISENEYTECETSKIISALRDRVDEVEQKLTHKKAQKKIFSFD